MRVIILVFLALLPISIFSQGFEPWELLYEDSQLIVEVQFKIDDQSCLNSVKHKIQYRLNGKLSAIPKFLIWTSDYTNCNSEIIYQEHSLNLSSANALANGSMDAIGDTWPSIEDEFLAKNILVKFYDVHLSSSASKLNGIKSNKKKEITNSNNYINNNEIEEAFLLANNLYLMNKNKECIELWDKIIYKYPNFAPSYYNRGLAKKYIGDIVNSKIDFEKAYSLGLIVN